MTGTNDRCGKRSSQLEPDVVHGCLRGIEQNEAPHSERSELPTQFAPYAARSAGNQYGSVAETGCHLLLFHVYFVAAEQVLYLDFPNTGHELVAAHLVYGRSYQHPDMMHFAVTYEPLLFGTYALVVGEKDSLDIVTGNNVDEILFVVEIIDGQVGQTGRICRLSRNCRIRLSGTVCCCASGSRAKRSGRPRRKSAAGCCSSRFWKR